MPYRFNIAKINDLDEEETLPDNENDNDEIEIDDLGERDYYEATHICPWCNGVNYNCHYCGGTGTIKRKY